MLNGRLRFTLVHNLSISSSAARHFPNFRNEKKVKLNVNHSNNKKTDIPPIPFSSRLPNIKAFKERIRLNSRRDRIYFWQINRIKLRPHDGQWDDANLHANARRHLIRDAGNHINRIFMCSITFYTLIFAIKSPNTFPDPIEWVTHSVLCCNFTIHTHFPRSFIWF